MQTLESGAVLHGRYRIARPIGKGGMGEIHEAVDLRLQNTVAVKQMAIEGADADRAFEHEAKLLAGLRHSALPVVIDYFADAGRHCLVMQYIEGEDLARVLERHGRPCAAADVLAWADAVLDALTYLHAHEPPVIHRDIKPANLKRMPTGEIVLLDFGLAKGRAESQATTAEKSLQGFTLKYAPLEQIAGGATDARSDLFALGATLYHLVTGAAPSTALERSIAVTGGRPDPLMAPAAANAAVPDVLNGVLLKALALDPGDRFQSAAEMRAALSHGLAPARLAPPRTTDARRVDAAMPSQTDVGRQTDLIVQVRFADSPLLGLEDWPTLRKPAALEQASESIELTYPRHPATGAPLPARLRVRVVAPDFTVEGQPEQLIEVPPETYSKRVNFLLTPRHDGVCRVNVEVYSLESIYLGTIAVEAEALGAGLARPILRVANLVLAVVARHFSPTVVEEGTPESAPIAPTIRLREESARRAAEAAVKYRAEAPTQVLPAAPPKSKGATLATIAGIAASLVLVASLGLWRSGGSPPPEPGGGAGGGGAAPMAINGTLSLNLTPWAAVESIAKTDGTRMPVDCPVTPCVISLPPGEYSVTVKSPDSPRPYRFTAAVTAGQQAVVNHPLPGFVPRNAVDSIERFVAQRDATALASAERRIADARAAAERAAEEKRIADARVAAERAAEARRMADAAAAARAADERRIADARAAADRAAEEKRIADGRAAGATPAETELKAAVQKAAEDRRAADQAMAEKSAADRAAADRAAEQRRQADMARAAMLEDFNRAVSRGNQALAAKRYDEAVAAFSDAKSKMPDEFRKQNLQAKVDESNRATAAATVPAAPVAAAPGVDIDRMTRDGLTALFAGDLLTARDSFARALGTAGKASPRHRAALQIYSGVVYATLSLQSTGDTSLQNRQKATDFFQQARRLDRSLTLRGFTPLARLLSPAILAIYDDAIR